MTWLQNFGYSIESMARNTGFTFRTMSQFQYLWGFVFGLFFSTIIHLLIISEKPRNLPNMIFYDKQKALERMYPDGLVCYEPEVIRHAIRVIDKVQMIFWAVMVEFFGIILLSLLFF